MFIYTIVIVRPKALQCGILCIYMYIPLIKIGFVEIKEFILNALYETYMYMYMYMFTIVSVRPKALQCGIVCIYMYIPALHIYMYMTST